MCNFEYMCSLDVLNRTDQPYEITFILLLFFVSFFCMRFAKRNCNYSLGKPYLLLELLPPLLFKVD